jgi:hypothetical protein
MCEMWIIATVHKTEGPTNMNHRNVSGLLGLLVAGVLGIALTGCAPEVLPATWHAPSEPAVVKLYQKQPKKYELLGTIMVPITSDMQLNDRGDATPAFEALKAKAAAMGANGLLLMAPAGSTNVQVTAGYKGTFYQVPVNSNPKTAVGQSIYVIKE